MHKFNKKYYSYNLKNVYEVRKLQRGGKCYARGLLGRNLKQETQLQEQPKGHQEGI